MTNDIAPGTCTLQALPALAFPERSFPSVVANFVVNHLPDPRTGVRELARVTALGGRMAMTIWPTGEAGWAPLVNPAFEQAGADPLPSSRLPESLDFPRTVEGLAGLAAEAGMSVTHARTVTWKWKVQTNSLWAGISGGVATPGARYQAQTPDVRHDIEQAFRRLASDAAPDGELHFDCSAVYVLATR